MFKKLNISFLIITFLTIIGAILHFYNLNWGAPYYFHPDERNIASAISQLQFPQLMNPHFFAYGSLPMYTIYFTGILIHYFLQLFHSNQSPSLTVTFEEAIIIGRMYSAFFATILIPILFFLGKKLKDTTTGLFVAFLATASIGFIQFSHFETFELWLTFFGVLLFWVGIESLHKHSFKNIAFMAIISGILIAIKISSLALLPIPIAGLVFQRARNAQQINKINMSNYLKFKRVYLLNLLGFLKDICLFICIASLIYIVTNPYAILDAKDLGTSMNYESGVALGTQQVFYTGIFFDTVPVVYQFLHVYPFLLNPLIVILFIPIFFYLLYRAIKTRDTKYLLLTTNFLLLFFSQAFFFVKWTRYMMPTLPFIYLIIALGLSQFVKKKHRIGNLLLTSVIVVSCIVAFSYVKTVFINTDTRISALTFAKHAIPDTDILSETSDLGIVPFQEAFPHIDTFNFYDFDSNSFDATELNLRLKLVPAQYIILPSQRVLQSRIENPKRFPKGNTFYKALFNGALGFQKIYETPCDIFCKITYLGDPIYWWEQTAIVFDRPTVYIFKKES